MAQISKMLVLLFLPLSSLAAVLEVDPAASKVEFLAVGKPGMLKIRGTGGKIEGKVDLSKKEILGELTVDLDTFDTGIALRNQHMKEKYLQTNDPAKKHAKLTITKFEVPGSLLKAGGKADLPFAGKLNFHGEQRDVTGTFSADVQGGKFSGTAKLPLVLSDYKVEIPSYLGVKVAETVEAEITLSGKISGGAGKL